MAKKSTTPSKRAPRKKYPAAGAQSNDGKKRLVGGNRQALSVPATWPYPSTGIPSQCGTSGYCVYKYAKSLKAFVRYDAQGEGQCGSGIPSGPSMIPSIPSHDLALYDIIFDQDPNYLYYSCCGTI